VYDKKGCRYRLVGNPREKVLVISVELGRPFPAGFEGEELNGATERDLFCNLTAKNAQALRTALPFTGPKLVGKGNSFGFGDRLGNAGAAHLRSLVNAGFRPVLAQQSIRELDRTGRSAQEVLDAATWAVFQEDFRGGYGADADHLKTFADIDRMMSAGFTMYTIDPSDYVNNAVEGMDDDQRKRAFQDLPWEALSDTPENFLARYTDTTFSLQYDVVLKPVRAEILHAAIKYGHVIVHTLQMYRYLKDTYPHSESEVELSVDETPYPTTPEEHLVIASELSRLGVDLVSLAPRFCGDFEKGIDFKGDLRQFEQEYRLHQAIAATYGGYKLSLHSGSDKFTVYELIGKLNLGTVHVKTAGTSYLEALRAIAIADPDLMRELLAFSLGRFDADRKTYHISADPAQIPPPSEIADTDLPRLLDDDHARQVFHVTYGSVLTATTPQGKPLFKDRLMQVLVREESLYETGLYQHFRRHISPFEQKS